MRDCFHLGEAYQSIVHIEKYKNFEHSANFPSSLYFFKKPNWKFSSLFFIITPSHFLIFHPSVFLCLDLVIHGSSCLRVSHAKVATIYVTFPPFCCPTVVQKIFWLIFFCISAKFARNYWTLQGTKCKKVFFLWKKTLFCNIFPNSCSATIRGRGCLILANLLLPEHWLRTTDSDDKIAFSMTLGSLGKIRGAIKIWVW